MTTRMTTTEYLNVIGEQAQRQRVKRQQRERDELVHPLIEVFQRCGWLVHHEEDSRRDTKSDNGFPDIVAVKKWHRVEVECKLDGEQPTPGQAAWLDAFALMRTEWHWVCVWHLSNYDAALGYIQYPDKIRPPGVWGA